jgi:hypothetical protein
MKNIESAPFEDYASSYLYMQKNDSLLKSDNDWDLQNLRFQREGAYGDGDLLNFRSRLKDNELSSNSLDKVRGVVEKSEKYTFEGTPWSVLEDVDLPNNIILNYGNSDLLGMNLDNNISELLNYSIGGDMTLLI